MVHKKSQSSEICVRGKLACPISYLDPWLRTKCHHGSYLVYAVMLLEK